MNLRQCWVGECEAPQADKVLPSPADLGNTARKNQARGERTWYPPKTRGVAFHIDSGVFAVRACSTEVCNLNPNHPSPCPFPSPWQKPLRCRKPSTSTTLQMRPTAKERARERGGKIRCFFHTPHSLQPPPAPPLFRRLGPLRTGTAEKWLLSH